MTANNISLEDVYTMGDSWMIVGIEVSFTDDSLLSVKEELTFENIFSLLENRLIFKKSLIPYLTTTTDLLRKLFEVIFGEERWSGETDEQLTQILGLKESDFNQSKVSNVLHKERVGDNQWVIKLLNFGKPWKATKMLRVKTVGEGNSINLEDYDTKINFIHKNPMIGHQINITFAEECQKRIEKLLASILTNLSKTITIED